MIVEKEAEFGYLEIARKILDCVENERYFECNIAQEPQAEEALAKEGAAQKSKRKKPTKNPRLVKKQKLDRKVKKWQSVVPKQRDANKPYEGEQTGIRKNASRSTKLS